MGCPTLCLSSAPLLVYSVQLHSLLAAETSLGSCSSNVSPGAASARGFTLKAISAACAIGAVWPGVLVHDIIYTEVATDVIR